MTAAALTANSGVKAALLTLEQPYMLALKFTDAIPSTVMVAQ